MHTRSTIGLGARGPDLIRLFASRPPSIAAEELEVTGGGSHVPCSPFLGVPAIACLPVLHVLAPCCNPVTRTLSCALEAAQKTRGTSNASGSMCPAKTGPANRPNNRWRQVAHTGTADPHTGTPSLSMNVSAGRSKVRVLLHSASVKRRARARVCTTPRDPRT